MATDAKLPVVKTNEVFHIGSMNQDEKATRFTSSFEGHCLSVSHCPEAWQSIAKLGGNPLWALGNPNGIFLDIWKAARTKKLRSLLEDWGIQNAYAERQPRWKVWDTDEEEQWTYMFCTTEAEAQSEMECRCIEEGPDGGPPIEEVEVLIGTPLLCQRIGLKHMDDMDAFDFLALVWCEDTQPQIDGVWWREDYAPECLSAPRGGIFPSRISRWKSVEVSFADVEDDETEERLACGFVLDARQVKKPQGASQTFWM